MAGLPFAPAALAALPALTVYAGPSSVRTSLHLQPGFALIVRADRRIDTVAIGDPRMVAAAPVRRGPDVFDVVLQPLADTGTTNMVLWLGDVTTIWNLDIGPGQRTADVIFLVTKPHTGAAPPLSADTHTPTAATVPPAGTAPPTPPGASPAAPTSSSAATPGAAAPPQAGAPAVLELRETVGPVTAMLHASRTRSGILLRYEITNSGDGDLVIRPSSVLVRADGRLAAYGMGRDSVDRSRPDVIPRGATETGVIEIAIPSARRIELALSLFPLDPAASAGNSGGPAARSGTTPAAPTPIVVQATFSGLDRLPVATTP